MLKWSSDYEVYDVMIWIMFDHGYARKDTNTIASYCPRPGSFWSTGGRLSFVWCLGWLGHLSAKELKLCGDSCKTMHDPSVQRLQPTNSKSAKNKQSNMHLPSSLNAAQVTVSMLGDQRACLQPSKSRIFGAFGWCRICGRSVGMVSGSGDASQPQMLQHVTCSVRYSTQQSKCASKPHQGCLQVDVAMCEALVLSFKWFQYVTESAVLLTPLRWNRLFRHHFLVAFLGRSCHLGMA